MTDYTRSLTAAGTYELPEEVFDDFGRPVTEEEYPLYRPKKKENQNPLPPDQGDDLASIVGDMGKE